MMNILKVIRSHEWWEYKLPPLLAIGYATTLKSQTSLLAIAPWLLFLLASIMVGAVYVSIINDITDIEEDLDSGKTNRMAAIPVKLRWIFPFVCILAGLFFLYCLRNHTLSALLYVLPWIAFSLYSFKPFRLKKRGIWGVFADAFGSHVFISLLMVSATSYFSGQVMDWIWFTAVGVWAIACGMRGILWHQFLDRDNDLKVGLNTFASKVEPRSFTKWTILLMSAEMAALTLMLIHIWLFLPLIFLLLYFFFVFICYTKFKTKIIAVIAPRNQPFHIFMNDYYQVFLPISLLLTAALISNSALIVLACHIILFPKNSRRILTDISHYIKGR